MAGAGKAERHLRRLLHGSVGHAGLAQIHGRAIGLGLGLYQSNPSRRPSRARRRRLRRISYAALLFLQVRHRKLLLFNSLFKAYSLAGPRPEPLRLLPTLMRRSISPDRFTYLKSCSNLRHLPFGLCLSFSPSVSTPTLPSESTAAGRALRLVPEHGRRRQRIRLSCSSVHAETPLSTTS